MAKKKAPAKKKNLKKKTGKTAAVKQVKRVRKPVAKAKPKRKPKAKMMVRRAAAARERDFTETAASDSANERLAVLQDKRAALEKMDAHLSSITPTGPAEVVGITQARENIVDATRALAAQIVAARSWAEMPVVTVGNFASIEIVKFVPPKAVLFGAIGYRFK